MLVSPPVQALDHILKVHKPCAMRGADVYHEVHHGERDPGTTGSGVEVTMAQTQKRCPWEQGMYLIRFYNSPKTTLGGLEGREMWMVQRNQTKWA